MNKEEAIIEMKKEIKMTHRYFDSWEWVTIKDGKYTFEDGCSCTPEMFWMDRVGESWDKDWDYYPEINKNQDHV